MAEEVKPTVPTKEQIAQLAKDIDNNERVTVEAIKRDVKEAVKSELKHEETIENIKKENEQLKKQVSEISKLQEESIKKMQEELKMQIDDVRNAKMGVTQNINPFNTEQKSNSAGLNLNDFKIVDGIEEESRKQFIEKYALRSEFGQK